MTAKELIAKEAEIIQLWNDGEIPYLTHICGGNEEQILEIFKDIKPTDWVLASHRCHYAYLLHGGLDLIERVKAGKSMFLYGPRFICSAIVGGVCGIAAGLAMSIKLRGGTERVHCFVGDGCEDQGIFYESVRFVDGRDLPCRFIIEDNNSSCGATKELRGVKPFQWPSCVTRYTYTPTYPHAGTNIRPKLKWKP